MAIKNRKSVYIKPLYCSGAPKFLTNRVSSVSFSTSFFMAEKQRKNVVFDNWKRTAKMEANLCRDFDCEKMENSPNCSIIQSAGVLKTSVSIWGALHCIPMSIIKTVTSSWCCWENPARWQLVPNSLGLASEQDHKLMWRNCTFVGKLKLPFAAAQRGLSFKVNDPLDLVGWYQFYCFFPLLLIKFFFVFVQDGLW